MRLTRLLCRFGWILLLSAAGVAAHPSARAQPADAEKRVALIIGNAQYGHVERLANPGHDATLIAATLQKLGFTLIGGAAQQDLDKTTFDKLVQTFGRDIQGADVALFYYAGHGLQVQGTNWLLPVDANPTRPQDLDFQMIDAGLVLKQMDGAGTRLNILILDACRNNPFATLGSRGVEGGLAQMRAPEGTLISFATQPGNVAVDGSGADGPYATALANAMRQPGLDIFRLFNQVGLAVKRDTQGAQLPWVSSSPIDGEFYFARGGEAAPDAMAVAALDSAPAKPTGSSRDATATKPAAPAAAAPQSLQALADKGQPEAQTDLALLYAKGIGVPRDYARALQLFEQAAAQNYARAQFLAGLMHERGYGVARSYAAALALYRQAADQEYPPAQVAVARFYGRGLGVPRDPAERNKWLQRAAAHDAPMAQHILGNIYRRGLGVPADPTVAAQWYQRAAAQDFAPAQAQLALLYEHGTGVKQDYAQALVLLRRAVTKDNALAQNALGVFYERGLGVPRDYAQARQWFLRAADQGNAMAEFNLGRLYADGLGVPRDKAQATQWFQKAADAGNEQAIARLARMSAPSPSPASGRG